MESDIRRAATLPARFYRDPHILDRQKERVFARAWHLGPVALRDPACPPVLPWTLLDGCLDEPLVFTRDEAGATRCLSNVCTHRGSILVHEPGAPKILRCGYHGRCFALDGRFLSMPEFADVENFPSAADDLARLAMESWGPFRFVSLDPAHPFEELIGPFAKRLDWMPLESMVFDLATSCDYLVEANWALYCDNYLEGFHIPFVHPALAKAIDWRAYRVELHPRGSLQIGIAAEGEIAFDIPRGHPDHGQGISAYYVWLFPGTMLNFYPWGLSVNIVTPLAVDRTRVTYLSFVRDASLRGRGAGANLDRVEMEDQAIVHAVQRGIRSRLYDRGRYSAAQERGVHHFHRLMLEALGDESDQASSRVSNGSRTSRKPNFTKSRSRV